MVFPEISSPIWIGIAFGLLGISFWIIGLLVFDRLLNRLEEDPPSD